MTKITAGLAATYDANGNMLQWWTPSSWFTQTWNIFNQITRTVSAVTSTLDVRYFYDADNNLARKVIGGAHTIYIGNYYERNLSTGIMTQYYYHGGQRIAMRVGTTVTSTVTFLHGDHLGSASVETNDSYGVKLAEMRYTPWGETYYLSDTLSMDKLFTGQRLEAGFGVYDYGARFYSPLFGRFLSADSKVPDPSNPISFNRYTYVGNSPVNHTDPDGHCYPVCTAIAGGIIGGAGMGILYGINSALTGQFNSGDLALAVGAGVVGGALIGTGVGVGAGATMLTTAAVAFGVSATAAGAGYLVAQDVTASVTNGEAGQFDSKDFALNWGVNGIAGSIKTFIPGASIGIDSIAGGVVSSGSDLWHGKPVNAGKAVLGGALYGASSKVGSLWEKSIKGGLPSLTTGIGQPAVSASYKSVYQDLVYQQLIVTGGRTTAINVWENLVSYGANNYSSCEQAIKC